MTEPEPEQKSLFDNFPAKPYSAVPYGWMFFALGTGNGLIWTATLEKLLQARTAHIVIWGSAAFLFFMQAIDLYVEDRRLKRWRREVEEWIAEHRANISKP